MLVAACRLKVGHDDETDRPIYREIGDAMPEAADWPWQTRETYLREGRLREVPVPAEPAAASERKRTPKTASHS